MSRKVSQLRLDRWASQQAVSASTQWAAPLKALFIRAKRYGWSLEKLRNELDKVELDAYVLAKSMVRSMQTGMGLGIIDGNMRNRKGAKATQ